MALLSPGVETKEINTQTTVVNNATGRAAIVGKFQWGAAYQVIQSVSEVELANKFGTPDTQTADYFISAANFLQYGNDLRVVRVLNEEEAKNASPLVNNADFTITNAGSNYTVGDKLKVKYLQTVIDETGVITSVSAEGKILGVFIPTEKVIKYAKSINQYPQLSDAWTIEIDSTSSGVSGAISVNSIVSDSGILIQNTDVGLETITNQKYLESIKKYNVPVVSALYAGEFGNNIQVEIVSKKDFDSGTLELTNYPYGTKHISSVKAVFGYGPQTDDQVAVIVYKAGAIAENYILSTKRGERDVYGNNMYMDDFFAKGGSKYIFMSSRNFPKGFSGLIQLSGGNSANESVTAGNLMRGWDLFADKESLHINLLIAGAVAGESLEIASTVQKHAVAIADDRQDCTAFISPPKDIVVKAADDQVAVDNIVKWRTATGTFEDNNFNVGSTYMFIDGNYKYQYDKYSDVNRWIPLSGDIAGLCARTDAVAQPWMSPAGYIRGQISNCVKLAINPRQAERDRLYQEAINPVTSKQGDGFVLFGDKTGSKAPTPFDRLNVRRLFNMLKKNIGDSSKYRLFEMNDKFTRSSFRQETAMYLQNIKALGGIYDFRVICDETNNTPDVIDTNKFVATFFIKPARSINYITLNFVATATGADFDELIGPMNQG